MFTIGTKDTTITLLGFYLRTATGTLMTNLSEINGNSQLLDEATSRTGKIGLSNNFCCHNHSLDWIAFFCCQNA